MAGLVRRREQRQRVFRWVVVSVLAVFFLLPLFAMLEFTTRGSGRLVGLQHVEAVVPLGTAA